MGKISKAMIQKSVIALSATVCLVLGQNCGHKMEFTAVNDGSTSMKDGAGIVTTLQPAITEPAPSEQGSAPEPDKDANVGANSPQSSGGGDTAGSQQSSEHEDDTCMDVASVDKEDLKSVATLDHHGNVTTIVICHKEGHHPMNKVVTDGALKGHLGHGDYIGTCGHPTVKTCQEKSSSTEHEAKKEGHGKHES